MRVRTRAQGEGDFHLRYRVTVRAGGGNSLKRANSSLCEDLYFGLSFRPRLSLPAIICKRNDNHSVVSERKR